jgi:hypothetical protein
VPKYSESIEQQGFFARLRGIPFRGESLAEFCYAVPNAGTSGGRRAARAGVRRKLEGVTPGVPDVECMVAVPPYTGCHIELKRLDGVPSDVKQVQQDMIARLESCGRKCYVAFGAGDAFDKLWGYLHGKA